MHWEEKIDLIKKHYSTDEFEVPHVRRKEILRKVESKFIARPNSYYGLNEYTGPFKNWWATIKTKEEKIIKRHYWEVLESILQKDSFYWTAFEISGNVFLYKMKLAAIINLFSLGQSITRRLHIIELKYAFIISMDTSTAGGPSLKFAGESPIIENWLNDH
ncbi:MAG: hypothetical protein AAF927_12110 [Bacteroidota bacterium]